MRGTQRRCQIKSSDSHGRRRYSRRAGDEKARSWSGLLTVGPTIEAAAWWYIATDNAERDAADRRTGRTDQADPARDRKAPQARSGTHKGGDFSFQPLWDWITAQEPDLFN